jgi:hypothetical protein
VSGPDGGGNGLSRAEERLLQLLEPLRADPQRPSATLVGRTVRTARWQRHARVPLQFVGHLAGTVLDAVRLLTRPERGE